MCMTRSTQFDFNSTFNFGNRLNGVVLQFYRDDYSSNVFVFTWQNFTKYLSASVDRVLNTVTKKTVM